MISCAVLLPVRSELGVDYLDTLLISFPPGTSAEAVQSVWSQVERTVNDSQTINAGVCDMDKNELSALYDFAQVRVAYLSIPFSPSPFASLLLH